MDPSTPSSRRPTCIPTFEEVKLRFRNDPNQIAFDCLVKKTHFVGCCPLEAAQVNNASSILTSDRDVCFKDVWNVIACLVCVEHQSGKTYKYKKQVMAQWQLELRLEGTPSRMPPSPYSRCSTPKSSRRSRSSPASASSPDPSSSQRLQASSHQLSAPPVSLRRSVSAPETSPHQVATNDAAASANEDVDMNDDPFTTPAIQTEASDPERPLHLSAVPSDDVTTTPPSRRSSRATSRTRSFVPGAASSLPLWRIRQDVRALLFEPLPSPKAEGILYAVESPQHHKVKIGYTMARHFRDRLRGLEAQYGRIFGKPSYLPGIPYVQLLRLEKLVHADLARYQCDYHISFSRGSGCRTHREWFDVDLKTAEKTMQFWWSAMRHMRLEPGRKLGQPVEDRLNIDGAMFDVTEKNTAGQFGDYRDHERTLSLWNDLLQLSIRDPKTTPITSQSLLLGVVALVCGLWILPSSDYLVKSTTLIFAAWMIWNSK